MLDSGVAARTEKKRNDGKKQVVAAGTGGDEQGSQHFNSAKMAGLSIVVCAVLCGQQPCVCPTLSLLCVDNGASVSR